MLAIKINKPVIMKRIFLKFSVFTFVALLILTAVSTPSCKKDQTCHGKVTVYDTTGKTVQGAAVRLDAYAVGGQVAYNGTTDLVGVVNFDIALPGIFDVTATHSKYPDMFGRGSLNVDEPRKEAAIIVRIVP